MRKEEAVRKCLETMKICFQTCNKEVLYCHFFALK
jgi:hypothetical protein